MRLALAGTPPVPEWLLADVERRFAAMDPRPWGPHRPMGAPPADEEYSRCLDPAKYVIVHQRARAWVAALVAAGLADAEHEELGERTLGGVPHVVSTTVLRPHVKGGRTAYVHEGPGRERDGRAPEVHLGIGAPDGVVMRAPVCGCDACDDGSAEQIDDIDAFFATLVTGDARGHGLGDDLDVGAPWG